MVITFAVYLGCVMRIIDNINETLKDDLSVEIKPGSKVSIAAACFSIYAFQELKDELKSIDELRFIFTSPTSVSYTHLTLPTMAVV